MEGGWSRDWSPEQINTQRHGDGVTTGDNWNVGEVLSQYWQTNRLNVINILLKQKNVHIYT